MQHSEIPVIDINLLNDKTQAHIAAEAISKACREHGFFYVSGHGVSEELQRDIAEKSAQFFKLPENEKLKIAMHKGGKAWRGFFPVNAELTSGKPDKKEGIYFGTELNETHPDVQAGTPLHGRNLFPEMPVGFDSTVLQYMEAVTQTGHLIMKGIALSLGLPENYFYEKHNIKWWVNIYLSFCILILFRFCGHFRLQCDILYNQINYYINNNLINFLIDFYSIIFTI